MNPSKKIRTAFAAFLGVLLLAITSPVQADVKDYEFQLIKSELKKGDAIVEVRLVNKKTQKPVPDAVIFAKRIDMAPDNMAMMDSPLESLPSTQPGVFQEILRLIAELRPQPPPAPA